MAPGYIDDVVLGRILSHTGKPSLEELQQRHDMLLDALSQPCWLVRDGFCIDANRAAKQLVRGQVTAGLGRFQDMVAIADRLQVDEALTALVAEPGRKAKLAFALGDLPNPVVKVEAVAVSVPLAGGVAVQVVGSVPAEKASMPRADIAAAYSLRDPVTGLPSRMLFREELDRACRRSRRFGSRLLLVRIDVSPENSLGHALDGRIVDRLAISMDMSLSSTIRETDYVGRLGPLSFAVIGADVTQMQDVIRLGDRIAAAVGDNVVVDGVVWQWNLRMGATIYPDDHGQPDMLIAHAEAALRSASPMDRGLKLHHFVPVEPSATADATLVDFAAE